MCVRVCVCVYTQGVIFMERRRQTHLENLWLYHSSYDHACLRKYRARALCNSLKLGYSPCRTLAYIDVLSYEKVCVCV